jgi:transposase InsO family protein
VNFLLRCQCLRIRDALSEFAEHQPAQGSQYGSDDWRRFCKTNHLEPSVSRRGNCWDNAVAQSFFSSLKKECIKLKGLAPGLTARSALEKFAAVQMVDVKIPTTDGRELLLTRYTQPEPELELLLERLRLTLPAQPSPKISVA